MTESVDYGSITTFSNDPDGSIKEVEQKYFATSHIGNVIRVKKSIKIETTDTLTPLIDSMKLIKDGKTNRVKLDIIGDNGNIIRVEREYVELDK